MPDMQPAAAPAATLPVLLETLPGSDDMDYALGCECADPSLQIERWRQEAGGAADAS